MILDIAILVGKVLLLFAIYSVIAHFVVYHILKTRYLKKQKWGLNICCGNTDGGGINADVVKRDVPNFRLVDDVYNLPFKDGEFENAICSHTLEHVEDPQRFHNELKRVSKNFTILVPPVWDFAAVLFFMEHKWQFLTLKTKHVNKLPDMIKLPYWWYHETFGQRLG